MREVNALCVLLVLLVPEVLLAARPATALRKARHRTWVFERPDPDSAAVRQLYAGELINARQQLINADGERWAIVALGDESEGFVRADHLTDDATLQVRPWIRDSLARSERPFGVGVRVLGETYGAALNLRYQSFARLGVTGSVGAVIDAGKNRGTAMSLGLHIPLLLTDLTPYLETGLSRLSYAKGVSTLRVMAFFLTVGVEWTSSTGAYLGLGASYIRSGDAEISFEYSDAYHGDLEVGTFGRLDPGASGSLRDLAAGVTLGYAF